MKVPVECRSCQKDYWECRKCPVYESQNTPCDFCGNLNAKPFVRATSKGAVLTFACPRCMEKLT